MRVKTDAVQISIADNVATALRDLQQNEPIVLEIKNKAKKIVVLEPIQYGHKFSLSEIGKGEQVIKYGEIIGIATQKIEKGCHVHIHNVESLRGRGDLIDGRKRR